MSTEGSAPAAEAGGPVEMTDLSGAAEDLDGGSRRNSYSEAMDKVKQERIMQSFGKISVRDIKGFKDPSFDLTTHFHMIDELQKQRNIERSRVGLAFRDVTVTVKVPENDHVETVGKGVKNLLPCFRGKSTERTILEGISGHVKPGRMLLVLGPPGSGCSTLLQVLAGRRGDFHCVTGDVLYNGEADVKPWLPHISLVGEDDIHYPTLSVEQTLMFAAKFKKHPEIEHVFDELQLQNLVDMVMHLLGIFRVKDTPVGNELVRGCSGGERKRVTIGEMIVSRMSLLFLDGYSKGLDSAASLDIAKTLRLAADCIGLTLVATQYQVSTEIFDVFDDVLLMSEGKQVFFGPTTLAKGFFTSMGLKVPKRRTLPDFLSTVVGCAADGDFPEAPEFTDSDDFTDHWAKSEECAALRRELEDPAQNISAPKPTHVTPEFTAAMGRRYALPFSTQLKLLVQREAILYRQTKATQMQRFARFFVISVLLGALFFDLDLSANGAYNRSGVLYFVVIFVSMASFGFLPAVIEQRNVVDKQKAANFYDPGAYIIAKSLVDLPFTMVEVTITTVLVYFMCGLNTEDNYVRLAIFWALLWSLDVCLSTFIRLFAVMLPDVAAAQGACAGVIVLFILFNGYQIARENIPPYFIWIHYLSPLKYAFEGLGMNEFYGLQFDCPGLPPDQVVQAYAVQWQGAPVSDSDLGNYQGCPLPGEGSGSAYFISRYDTPEDENMKFAWLAVIIAYYFLWLTLSFLAIRHFTFSSGGVQVRYQNERKHLVRAFIRKHQAARKERKAARKAAKQAAAGQTSIEVPGEEELYDAYFTWENLCYTVDVPPSNRGGAVEKRKLLDNVAGYCKPGMLTALMGSSGAGKTTLLDVLARRKTGGSTTGDVLVNNEIQDNYFKRLSGYVEQMDMHMANATVEEAFWFSARLRLPPSLSEEKRRRAVEDTLELLGLGNLRKAVIGSAITAMGIPMEAKKRVTIGVELVANPSILFMDEPTSGLDTQAALTVMKAARKIADSGRAVVCTIHQPSTELFEMFDYLLLMQRGGKTVYWGSLGEHSATLVSYFERNGAPAIDGHQNPADYMLTVIGAGVAKRAEGEKVVDWHQTWLDSPEAAGLRAELHDSSFVPYEAQPFRFASEVSTTLTTQMHETTKRAATLFWRDPNYNLFRQLFAVMVALMLGLTFFQLGNNQADLFYRVSVLFFTSILGAVLILNCMPPLINERPAFYRELESGTYRHFAYFWSSGLIELPYAAFSALLFTVIFYWLVGLNSAPERFATFYGIYLIFTFYCVFYGQFVGAMSPNLLVGQALAPALMSLFTLFCGFMIKQADIPGYLIWLHWFNPYHYFLSTTTSNELHDQVYYCEQATDNFELVLLPILPAPDGIDEFNNNGTWCYQSETISGTFSVLFNWTDPRNASDIAHTQCTYCSYTNADYFLESFSFSYDDLPRDLGLLAAFAIFFRILTWLALRYKRHGTR